MPVPDESQEDDSLAVRAVLRLARRLRQAASEAPVSGSALGLLATLHREGAMSAVELARREGLQPQSLSRVLAKLDTDGLIGREVDSADRRRQVIALTPEGRAGLGEAMALRRRWLADAMAERLSASERTTLLESAELMLRLAE